MNTEKIKELLAEITSLLDEEKPVVIDKYISLVVKPRDEPEPMTWFEAMEKFGPDGTDKEWRLPTQIELAVLWENKEALSGPITGGWYWSSTENSSASARNQRFSDGLQTFSNKYNTNLVRCVRR